MAVDVEGIGIGMGDHVVQFYEHESDLVSLVGRCLSDAAEADAVSIVVATDAHRRAFAAELEAAGISPQDARRDGDLVMLDAAATMAAFMPDGRIERNVFRRVVGSIVRRAAASGRPVHVYGEMVALLWSNGHVPAAIEVEERWNELARELEFSLMCAYPLETVQGDEHAEALQRVCHLHSSVLPAPARGRRHPAELEVSAEFAAQADAPRAARQFVAGALRRSGHDESLIDDAQLVVSELATNAIRHAGSAFSVTTRVGESSVRISLHDASSAEPRLRDEGPRAISGRGLTLIAALAAGWGAELTSEGKTVWAELAARGSNSTP